MIPANQTEYHNEQKLRILHVIIGLGTGGAESMLYKLVSHLNKEKFENSVVTLNDNGPLKPMFEKKRIQVIPLKLPIFGGDILNRLNLTKKIYQTPPDVIMGWMYHGNFVAYWMRKALFPKAKLIWNIRCSWNPKHQKKIWNKWIIESTKKRSRHVDCIIANSHVGKKSHQEIGFIGKEFIVIPNGFDTELYKPSIPQRKLIREQWGWNEQHQVVGMVARYDPYKDFPTFVKAAHECSLQNRNARFIAIGTSVNNSNPELVSLRKKFQLEDKMIFAGERSDLHLLYPGFDILTLTSTTEGFPNVIGEGLCSGLPCISTDVGDVKRIIEHDDWIVPVQDPGKLATAWNKVFSLPQEQRRTLGLQNRQRMKEKYSIEVITHQFERQFRNIPS